MAHWISHIALSFLAFLHLGTVVLGILMVHATAYFPRYDESTDVGDYVPLYLGACWTIVWNLFETISLCFVKSTLLGVARDNSRDRIFCHIVGVILLIIGFLLPSFRAYNYESGSGESGDDQRIPDPTPFSGVAPIITLPFAAGLHAFFTIINCVGCCRERRRPPAVATEHITVLPAAFQIPQSDERRKSHVLHRSEELDEIKG